MSDAAILSLGALLVIVGIGGAAFVLRWEIRAQLRARRHRGLITSADWTRWCIENTRHFGGGS